MGDLVIERCDPRERAAEIVGLFGKNGHPEFSGVFDRVYRPRAPLGLRSWIGVQDGDTVMHVSVTPQAFGRGDGKTATVGIMGDLMVDASVRDFWGPLRMMRRVVGDLKEEGELGCLVTTSTPQAAGIFKAAGFRPRCHLRRFVLPAMAPARIASRLINAAVPRRIVAVPLGAPGGPELECATSGEAWRPRPSDAYYATRIPRYGAADGTWIGVGARDGHPPNAWVLLSRHQDWPEYQVTDGFWPEGGRRFAEVFLGAAAWARSQGARALSISAVDESAASKRFRRLGFVRRADSFPFFVNEIGEGEIPPPEDWFLTGLIASMW